jgi:hypothetical protein
VINIGEESLRFDKKISIDADADVHEEPKLVAKPKQRKPKLIVDNNERDDD